MRTTLPVLLCSLLMAITLAAAEQAPTQDIPLRNWPVSFDHFARPTPSGKLQPVTNAAASNPGNFVAIAPCRLVDTRNANGAFGGPMFAAGETRHYIVPNGGSPTACGVPLGSAYSLNFTVVDFTTRGNLRAFPTGTALPNVSTLNFGATVGYPVANAAIVPADATGSIDVYVTQATNVIIDINGYFTDELAASSSNTPNTLVLRDGSGNFAAGQITATKVIGAVYQDFAEWVPSSSQVAAGTVVVLDPADGRRVMPSNRAYDTAVAGVVSENPGIVLGTAAANKLQIATTGRVRVLVDADGAPIRIGDLLVTSNIPGTAMRSQPLRFDGNAVHRPGTIIGKALEPLASGKGEILVLLSLQ